MALMTAHAFNAQSAYGAMGQAAGSDRDIEVTVFRTSVARLRELSGPDFRLSGRAAEVLAENLKLWDALVVDLLHPDNTLSDPLAQQLIKLSAFVRHHTHGLYNGTAKSVDVLIEINTAILKGLLGQPGEGGRTAAA
ncbi:MAG: flagellar biosynthesis regulator FlaF [Litorimonas sp.]